MSWGAWINSLERKPELGQYVQAEGIDEENRVLGVVEGFANPSNHPAWLGEPRLIKGERGGWLARWRPWVEGKKVEYKQEEHA